MPTPFFIDGFEHGVLSSSGGGLYSSVAGSPTLDTSVKRTGSYSLRCYKTSAAACYISVPTLTASQTYIVGRFYIRVDTAPSTATGVVRHDSASGVGFYVGLGTDRRLNVQIVGNSIAYSSALTLGQWYRVDFRFYCGGATYSIDWQVDGSDLTGVTLGSQTASSWNTTTHRLGSSSSCTVDLYIDDVVYSYTSGDYPIGAGAVEGLYPANASCTQNVDTNIEDEGSVDITAWDGANPAYDHLDEVPVGSGSDYIKQIGGTSSIYAGTAFANTSQTTIHGAIAIEAYRSASASPSNAAAAKIYDEDGLETTIYASDMSETSTFYKSKILPAPTGGWDQAAVNALEGRVGYATDYAPVPHFYGLMIQVAYAEAAGIDLIAAENYQTQASDAPSITQLHVLTAQENYAVQVSDSPAITQVHNLTADENYAVQVSDQATISISYNLIPDEGYQLQVSDSPALTQVHNLTPAEAYALQVSDVPTLTQTHNVVAQEGSQIQVSDSPALTQIHNLQADENYAVQVSDNATLEVGVLVLTPQENYQIQISDAPAITQVHNVVPAENYAVQVSDQPTLTQTHIFTAQENFQIQASDSPALVQIHNLAAQENYAVQWSDSATITIATGIDLYPQENYQTQFSEPADLYIGIIEMTLPRIGWVERIQAAPAFGARIGYLEPHDRLAITRREI